MSDSLMTRQSCFLHNLFKNNNKMTNLLPKEEIEFAKADYWDKFFKERGSKKFEWYGEYHELCGELHKYIKQKDKILVVGCGNSRLSSDLYDVGNKDITNIDISSVVIKQMKSKEGQKRPDMVFQQMDALNMSFEKEKFNVILDKGTLDALMPTDSEDDHNRAEKLFHEVDKVLKLAGRFIMISLLQPHILKRILNHFPAKGWMIRIIRCLEVEKKNIRETGQPGMPVFMVVCTKLKKMENVPAVLELNVYINDNIQRIKSKKEVLEVIDGVQKAQIELKNAKDEVEIEFTRNGENKVRYLIYITDASHDQQVLRKYGAFIIPQGRETEWMFGTTDGRKYLLVESGFDRLAIIALKRGQNYESKAEIQDELARTILQFAPCFMEGSDIPYMTIGDSLGERKTIHRDVSELSGEVVVEEVEIDGERFRRLVFMDNQAVVQSEVKLQKDQKKNKWKIDGCLTPNSHIGYMSIAVGLVTQPKSVLIVGLGGGGLCLFLNRVYPNANVTGVEIDPVIVKIANDYFGLREGKNLKTVIADGVEVLKQNDPYDVIILDVDSKEQGSAITSPPPQFLQPNVLESLKKSIGKIGVVAVNVVSRIESVHEDLTKKLRSYFSLIASYNMKEDVNRILFLSNKHMTEDKWKGCIIAGAQELLKTAKNKLKTGSVIDLDHFETELTV